VEERVVGLPWAASDGEGGMGVIVWGGGVV